MPYAAAESGSEMELYENIATQPLVRACPSLCQPCVADINWIQSSDFHWSSKLPSLSHFGLRVQVLSSAPDLAETPPISEKARALLVRILDKVPAERATTEEIRVSAFVSADGAEPLPAPLSVLKHKPSEEQVLGAVHAHVHMGGLVSC